MSPGLLALALLSCGAPPPPPAVVLIEPPGALPPPVTPPSRDPRIRHVTPGLYEVESSLFESFLDDPARLAPRAWLEPEEQQGRLVGYRLHGVQPGGVLAQLGLLEDDRIEVVNGESARSEEAFFAARAAARRTGQVAVVLWRHGTQELLLYRLVYPGPRPR